MQAQLERMVGKGETPEFVGRGVACLACDKQMFKKTGSILLTADLCDEYRFIDNDGWSFTIVVRFNRLKLFVYIFSGNLILGIF